MWGLRVEPDPYLKWVKNSNLHPVGWSPILTLNLCSPTQYAYIDIFYHPKLSINSMIKKNYVLKYVRIYEKKKWKKGQKELLKEEERTFHFYVLQEETSLSLSYKWTISIGGKAKYQCYVRYPLFSPFFSRVPIQF